MSISSPGTYQYQSRELGEGVREYVRYLNSLADPSLGSLTRSSEWCGVRVGTIDFFLRKTETESRVSTDQQIARNIVKTRFCEGKQSF